MRLRPRQALITQFSAISLTDIVFLLLIFFLLSSTFILQPGVKVALPRTTTTEISAEKSVVLTLTADGGLYLNDERVSRGTLGAKLRQRLLSVGNPILVLRADRRVTLEQAVEVMDIAKHAGGERFVIATRPVEEG